MALLDRPPHAGRIGPARPLRRTASLAIAASAVSLLAACSTPTTGPSAATTAPSAAAAAATSAAPIHLRVIAFNDFHGHLEAGSLNLTLADPRRSGATLRVPTGGADALIGLADALRSTAPHHLLISSGDLIGASPLVSALFRHEPTIEAFNRASLDVGVVGNHEFDAGMDELLRLRDGGCTPAREGDPVRSCGLQAHTGARFPFLGANVQRAGAPSPLPASKVFQAGPVKVAVIGAVTRVTPQLVVPSGVAGLDFTDEVEAINAEAARLKAQGIQTLIVSLHEGAEIGAAGRPADWNDTTCPGLRGEAVDIARRITPDVDLILTAHTHQGYNCRISGRPMMQAVSYGRGLSVADLHIDPRTGDVLPERTVARNLPVLNRQTPADHREALAQAEPPAFATALRQARARDDITRLVQTATQAAAPQANRVVGRVAAAFDRRGRGDSSLGRLIADAQWEATRAPEAGGSDFALMNPGGIRTDLACRGTPPCPVTYGDLFSMQPFGNSLVVMTLTGAQIQALLEQQDRFGRDGPLMSPSEGLSYRWVGDAPKGQRAVDIRIKGVPLQATATYRVTVNSFMAEGGDGLSVLKQGQQRLGGGQDIDVLMAYLQKGVAQPSAARIR